MIAGIYSDGTAEAVELARDAKAAGRRRHPALPADAVHVGRAAQARHGRSATSARSPRARDLPIIVFEYPPASGIGYAPETLAALAEIPQVAA